ncbi:MAG: DUF4440 domain-containing protein [Longimicrobiales bacterium]|nr:DUF4440 domain-containing protein [Longimicrobiales bacterium]
METRGHGGYPAGREVIRAPAGVAWIRGAAFLVAAALAVPSAAAGQDRASAIAAVEQIFEGMRTANPDLVRAVFARDARFAMVNAGQGTPSVRVQSVDGWIGAIADSGGSWDERIYDVEAVVDGNMASVWAPYTFYLDGAISHCGINSIEMLHDGQGWKVTQISDTRRRADCPDPIGGR